MGVFLFLFFIQHLWATPEELEVWFITPPASTLQMDLLRPTLSRKHLLASAPCEQVGSFCLDAKTGQLTPRYSPAPTEPEIIKLPYEALPQIPTASSLDRQMVNCEQGFTFDIFCGKAKPIENPKPDSGLEIWIDVSSSMRSVDGAENCYRKQFMQALFGLCGQSKPLVKGFDVEIREIGFEESCINSGLNDAKKIMEWIEESKAKKLIVITDVYEYQAEFAAFISEKNAKVRGDRGHFPSVQLMDQITSLAKWCE